MAKRFKLRFSRVIQSCRSKDPSTLPSNPVPSFLRRTSPPSSNNFQAITTRPPAPAKRHVSFCGFRSRQPLSDDDRTRSPPDPHEFEWEREDRWHVVAKVYDVSPRRKIYTSSASPESDIDDDVSPPTKQPKNKRRVVKSKKAKKTTTRIRISTSSFETGLFSDDGGETEALFSTDSSPPIRRSRKKRSQRNPRRSVSRENGAEIPARLSVFQRLIPCTVEGKVRESFAVVKKSADPYEDFRRSMMDMILEKQMFDEKELEQLLNCFLSLNAAEHHRVIVAAFMEIWEALFSSSGSARSSSGGPTVSF